MSTDSFRTHLERALDPPFAGTDIGRSLFRTCLESMHAHYMSRHALQSPSLELGVGDGSASMFINGYRRQNVSVGLDMPLGTTFETKGLWWHPVATHYQGFVGSTMENIPFSDETFASVYTSETMFYGMDLDVTAKEISRALKPGGKFYCFNATDQWYRFPALLAQLKANIPSFSIPSDDDFVALFERAGLSCTHRSCFFSPALEILLQSVVDIGAGQLSETSLLDMPAEHLSQKLSVLAELLAHEHDLPGRGFHHFLVFEKPSAESGRESIGRAQTGFDPFDQLRCTACRASNLSLEPETLTCTACGTTFDVVCGVPMMIRPDDGGFSSVDLSASVTKPIQRHLNFAAKTGRAVFEQYRDEIDRLLKGANAKELDVVVMADPAFERQLPISRQTGLSLRYWIKHTHPHFRLSLSFATQSNFEDHWSPSTTPVFALYITNDGEIPKPLDALANMRPAALVKRVLLNLVT